MSRGTWVWLVMVLLAGYLATGVTVVQPDEVGIIRRFGAIVNDRWEPGLHWGLPWGCDRVDTIKLNQTRTLAVGATGQAAAPFVRIPDPAGDDFLTGDLNLVTAEALVQYRVRDPAAYLFRTSDIDGSLSTISEWALTRALTIRGIDELLTTGRADVADGLTRVIQKMADDLGLGVSIVAIRLGRVAPPTAVAPAFADAARARSDRRQAITRAEEYRDRAQAEARAQAREIGDSAAGRVDLLVEPARGEAARFTQVLAEARKNPGAFRQRLFLETIAELLPRFRRTLVVAPGQDLDISLFGAESLPKAQESKQ
jgi:membrane protease subunit HflK